MTPKRPTLVLVLERPRELHLTPLHLAPPIRISLAAALLLGTFLLWKLAAPRDALVIYCAHDAVFSEAILRDFEKRTGIAIAIRFDTEATKSLGLTELIVREKDAPRCDVFWNNESLGTADLAERGLLEPYRGAGFLRIPAQWKDADARWTGFAARLRVVISNWHTAGDARSVTLAAQNPDKLASLDLSRAAIAKPLYGTTLTHFTVLWHLWGAEKMQAWYRDARRRGLREVAGNAAVKDLVAAGVCDFGFTDTDDFFEAKDAGAPVAMQPVRRESGATICIPNTVAIIRGTKRLDRAQQLVDFLLSEQTELALVRSKSRQIPLGLVPADQVPVEVRELQRWAADAVPLAGLTAARAECLAWLKAENRQ